MNFGENQRKAALRFSAASLHQGQQKEWYSCWYCCWFILRKYKFCGGWEVFLWLLMIRLTPASCQWSQAGSRASADRAGDRNVNGHLFCSTWFLQTWSGNICNGSKSPSVLHACKCLVSCVKLHPEKLGKINCKDWGANKGVWKVRKCLCVCLGLCWGAAVSVTPALVPSAFGYWEHFFPKGLSCPGGGAVPIPGLGFRGIFQPKLFHDAVVLQFQSSLWFLTWSKPLF